MTELGTATQTVLPATAPYNLGRSLRALADFRPGLRDISLDTADVVRRAFPHPGDPSAAVVVQVAERDDGAPGVALTVFSAAPLSSPELDAVGARVSDWLGLRDDQTEFLRRAEADGPVRALLTRTQGLHQVRFSSLAEGVAYFTLLQNSAQWYATLRKRRLALFAGTTVSLGGQDFTAFPDLPQLTHLTPAQLLPYAGARARAERMVEVLGAVAALDEDLLRHGPYEQARASLLAVRGIGDFTAHALLLRALGRPDAVPLEMEQHLHTAKAVYGDTPPSPSELRERYGPWIGWWAYTCRTALTWLEQDKKDRERAARGARPRTRTPRAERRPRPAAAASTRPRPAPRNPAPWSPTDPGPAVDDLTATALDALTLPDADVLTVPASDTVTLVGQGVLALDDPDDLDDPDALTLAGAGLGPVTTADSLTLTGTTDLADLDAGNHAGAFDQGERVIEEAVAG